MENNLPKSWEKCQLGDVLTIQNGYAFSSKEFKKAGIPLIRQSNLAGEKVSLEKCVYLDQKYTKDKKDFVLRKGDILIGMSGSIGKLCRYDLEEICLQNQRTGKVVIKEDRLNKGFIWHYLNTIEKKLQEKGKGLGVSNVSADDIESLDILLPPIEQQKFIADKLDSLLAKVKDAQFRLDTIPVILNRFRQSVLAAAFSGELTKAWRVENARFSATEDLASIKDYILKSEITNRERNIFEETNKISLDSYEEQFVVPSSWKACCIGLIGLVNNGSTPSRKIAGYWNGTIPWVSSGEVQNNVISESREKITQNGLDNCSSKLFPIGTVLIAMIGEGKTRGQSSILNLNAAINQNIAAVQIAHGRVNSEYLWYWFRYQYENNRNYGSGSGPQALNCQRVRELPFVLAPKAEQDKIVEKIKSSFEMLNGFIERYRKSKDYTDKLEQSILAKAFRGELVR